MHSIDLYISSFSSVSSGLAALPFSEAAEWPEVPGTLHVVATDLRERHLTGAATWPSDQRRSGRLGSFVFLVLEKGFVFCFFWGGWG